MYLPSYCVFARLTIVFFNSSISALQALNPSSPLAELAAWIARSLILCSLSTIVEKASSCALICVVAFCTLREYAPISDNCLLSLTISAASIGLSDMFVYFCPLLILLYNSYSWLCCDDILPTIFCIEVLVTLIVFYLCIGYIICKIVCISSLEVLNTLADAS